MRQKSKMEHYHFLSCIEKIKIEAVWLLWATTPVGTELAFLTISINIYQCTVYDGNTAFFGCIYKCMT